MNTIYTIGYGGRKIDDFLSLLQSHGIKLIVDVRLRPDKAHDGSWVRAKSSDKGIERWLTLNGVEYISLIELGNLFLDFNDWADRYTRLLESAGDLLVERLINLKADGEVCLICAEKSPLDCHRKIIADYLENLGLKVVHII